MDKKVPIFIKGWVAPALAGVSILACARLGYLAVVLIISLLMEMETDSLARVALILGDWRGWVPYLLWGSLAGLLATYGQGKLIWGWLLCCTIGLWMNEILWFHGSHYRVSFEITRLAILFNPNFWKEVGIITLLWWLPHLTATVMMPRWMTTAVPIIEQTLLRR
jgi:hypothetical protein